MTRVALSVIAVFIALTISAPVTAQPLGDALAIDTAMKDKDYNRVLLLLSKYSNTQNRAGNMSHFAGNGYILSLFPTIPKSGLTPSTVNLAFRTSSAAPGLKPTVVADALGRFVADRFKQELTEKFLRDLHKAMEDQEELQKLFPATFEFLKTANYFKPKLLITTLRHTLDADFADLADNLEPTIVAIVGQGNTPLEVRIAFSVVDDLREGDGPFEIALGLDKLIASELAKPGGAVPAPLQNAVKLTSVMARSLMSNGRVATWQDVQRLSASDTAAKVFIGLVIESDGSAFTDITLGGQKMGALFDASTADLPDEFGALLSQVGQLTKLVKRMEHARSSGATAPSPADYAASGIEALGVFVTLSETLGGPTNAELRQFLAVAGHAIDISKRIQEHQYGAALTSAVAAVEVVLSPRWTDEEKKASDQKILRRLSKHGTFAVNVISAESGAELAQVIEDAALPVGSYRLKSERGFTMFLNAYGGVSGGWNEQNDGLFGPTAPVGLSVNTHHDLCLWHHTTLFLPVLDVGAIALLRVNDPDQELPELTWGNIITPGLYLYLGWDSIPLALGFGAQYGPELVDIKGDTATTSSRRLRYSVVGAVDIPMATLIAK